MLISLSATILQYHADVRQFAKGIDVRLGFKSSIQAILSSSENIPTWLTLSPADESHIVSASCRKAALRLFVSQQAACIELYSRYQPLTSAESRSIGQYNLARNCGQLGRHISKLTSLEIDQLGPPRIDMIYRARECLQETIPFLDDPSAVQQAKVDLKHFDTSLASIDSLRRLNAIIKKPRAYRGEASTKPSRASSPIPTLQPPSAPLASNNLETAVSPFDPNSTWHN